jgi:hypothetical protein
MNAYLSLLRLRLLSLLHFHLQHLNNALCIVLFPFNGRLQLVEVFLNEGGLFVVMRESFGLCLYVSTLSSVCHTFLT